MKIFQFAMGVLGFLAVMAVSYAYGYSLYSLIAMIAMAVVLLVNILHSPKWSDAVQNGTKLLQAACAAVALVCMIIDTVTVRVSLVNYIALAALALYVIAEVVQRVKKQ